MIISRGRSYIFVHIPKTGGTALSLALEGRAMKDDILIGDTPKARRRRGRLKDLSPAGRLWKHSTLADIDGVVGADELDAMFLFTLVRNPWDRMVSYYHWLRDQNFDHPAVGIAKGSDFAGFLTHPFTRESIRNAPYGSYLRDAAGRERPVHFIRLEHLDEDLGALEAHLGFALTDIPHANRSDRRADYRSYYSDDLADRVAELCREDIDRFGYRF
jgi:hypothetical protein